MSRLSPALSVPQGVALSFWWGDHRLAEYFLPARRAHPLGWRPRLDLGAGAQQVEVAQAQGEALALRYVRSDDPDGDVQDVLLREGAPTWVDLGDVMMEARLQRRPRLVPAALLEAIDHRAVNIFLALAGAASLLVLSALNRDLENREDFDSVGAVPAPLVKRIVRSLEVPKRALERKPEQPKGPGEASARAKAKEGAMGAKFASPANARSAPRGDTTSRELARQIAEKVFGSRGAMSSVLADAGLGGALKVAMGQMTGPTVGDARGADGLGLRDLGPGGGGEARTIGIRGLATRGRGGIGGGEPYGATAGLLRPKAMTEIDIAPSVPVVIGSLDKDLIRAVIRRNVNQIRFCYENQLSRFPKLSGKVAAKFVISPSGTVASSEVAQSTVDNDELEACVAGRVRTWLFPIPKGGGVVIVTYPFLFKQSGN